MKLLIRHIVWIGGYAAKKKCGEMLTNQIEGQNLDRVYWGGRFTNAAAEWIERAG
ncbi:MAG: hypothetical protein OXN17_22740 [Candidatus Poribacteria bacterium]|nr:hypothetical protein [Candidatus Poribacteria bacterium]MDE0504417.1 hypothetical protein [Candidatus Poribacteria bacterium]